MFNRKYLSIVGKLFSDVQCVWNENKNGDWELVAALRCLKYLVFPRIVELFDHKAHHQG